MLTRKYVLLLALIATLQPVSAEQWQFEDVERIVALSDIHGAYVAFVETLQHAGVIDDSLSWSGGRTHLVIVGDLLDRGPNSRDAMDLVMRLEQEAGPAGGQVHVLIGNHEAMNLIGDLRYVSLGEYAAFKGEETAEERDRWFGAYQSLRASADEATDVSRETFERKYPAGFFAHRRAFAPEGKYGRWLLSKPVIVVINGTAFVHGGLSPMIAEIGLQGVNGVLVGEMDTYVRQLQRLIDQQLLLPTDGNFDHPKLLAGFVPSSTTEPEVTEAVADVIRLNESDLHATNGPLWYRGNVLCNAVIETDRLDDSLRAIGANRVVIGHTPTFGRRVLERFDGRIFEVDTGMLKSYYKGSGNALFFEQDRVFVINQDSAEAVPPTPHPRQVGSRPGAPMSTSDIEVLLRSGDIVSRNKDEQGHDVFSISNEKHMVNATFVKRRRRGGYPEVAAYRLDRLLEFNMVPVTVMREVDGKDGSLQFLPTGWIDEEERQERNIGGVAWCPLPDQWDAMKIFDTLVSNAHRNAETMRYDMANWLMMLVDHDKAFTTSTSMLSRYKDVPMHVGPSWKAALTSLSDEVLAAQLADVLDEKRIRALGKRRDMLLSQ
jgi:hypothetical protein